MQTREGPDVKDPPNTRPTRVVTMTTAIMVATPFILAVGGYLFTQIQSEARRQQHDLQVVEKLSDLKADFKAMAAKLDAKSDADADQSAAIRDLDRRVTRLESR